jgi:hypothetical protein
LLACAAAAALFLTTACGARPRHAAEPTTTRTAVSARPHRCAAVQKANTATRFLAAVAEAPMIAYRAPGAGVIAHFRRRNQDHFPTVFSVLAMRMDARCRPSWYRVQLPIRPNGTTGWVRATDVAVSPVHTEIVIHVHARKLQLLRAGRVVFTSSISTGAPDTPTPLGRFYVKERLIPENPSGPWGPAALGTSAYSPVLKSWSEGGPIGIHGTDDPTAIGRPVSHGCIRLPNRAMRRLFALTPAGTPILIKR